MHRILICFKGAVHDSMGCTQFSCNITYITCFPLHSDTVGV